MSKLFTLLLRKVQTGHRSNIFWWFYMPV